MSDISEQMEALRTSRTASPSEKALSRAYFLAGAAPSADDKDVIAAIVAYGDLREKESKTSQKIRDDRAELARLKAENDKMKAALLRYVSLMMDNTPAGIDAAIREMSSFAFKISSGG